MADSVEREVRYILTVVNNDANARTLRTTMENITTATDKADQAADRSGKKREAVAKKAATAESKELKRVEADRLKAIKAVEAAEKKAHKERVQRIEKVKALQQQSAQKNAESSAKMRDATNTGTEGIIKLGRGMAMLGVVGEESSRKMLEGLIKVQATFDILRGGIEVWRSLSMAASAYRLSLEGVAAANAAVAVSGGVAGAAGGAGAARGIGAAGAVRLGIAAGSGGLVAGTGLMALIGGGLGANAIREMLNGDVYNEGSQGFAANTKINVPILGRMPEWMGRRENDLSATIRALLPKRWEGKWTQGGSIDAARSLRASNEDTERFFASETDAQAGRRQQISVDIAGQQARLSQGKSNRDFLAMDPTLSNLDRIKGQQRLLSDDQARVRSEQRAMTERGSTSGNTGSSQAIHLQSQLVGMAGVNLGLSQERLAEEIRISDERIRGAVTDLKLSRENITDRKALIELQTQSMLSSKARFGLLSSEEQTSAVDLFRRAKAGGDITREEARRLATLPGQEAGELAQQAGLDFAVDGVDEFYARFRESISEQELKIEDLTIKADLSEAAIIVDVDATEILLDAITAEVQGAIEELRVADRDNIANILHNERNQAAERRNANRNAPGGSAQ